MVVVRKKKANPLPPSTNNLEFGPWAGGGTVGPYPPSGQGPPPPLGFPGGPNPPPPGPPVPPGSGPPGSMNPPPPTLMNNPIPPMPTKRGSIPPNAMKQQDFGPSNLSPLMFQHQTMDQNKMSHGGFTPHGLEPPPPSALSRIQESQLGLHQIYGREPTHREANYYSYPSRRKSNAAEEIPSAVMAQSNLMAENMGLNKGSYSLQNQLVHEHMAAIQHQDEWNPRSSGANPGPPPMRVRSHPRNVFMSQQQAPPPQQQPPMFGGPGRMESSPYEMQHQHGQQHQQHREQQYNFYGQQHRDQQSHMLGPAPGPGGPGAQGQGPAFNDSRYPPQYPPHHPQYPPSSSPHYHY
jgi:hypothetical protein